MTTPSPSDPVSTASQIESDIATITSDVAQAATTITKANAWTAFVGFFTALPGIVSLIREFMTWINAVSGNNPQAFIANLGQAFSQLANSKTEEDHANAAKNLAGIISKLPSS